MIAAWRSRSTECPLTRTSTWTSGPTIRPTSREVWSGACMTGPSVSPAPTMTCRRKYTTPDSLKEILAELIADNLTPTAALEQCQAVWGMVLLPSSFREAIIFLPSHSKQNMEEPQTAISPLLTARIASTSDTVQLTSLQPGASICRL